MSAAYPFLLVRTGLRYATMRQLIQAGTQSGDVIKIYPGTHVVAALQGTGDPSNFNGAGSQDGIPTSGMTIEWEFPGQRPVLDLSAVAQTVGLSGGDYNAIKMGQFNTELTVRGIHFIGSRHSLNNGIFSLTGYGEPTPPPARLTVEQCVFERWVNGMLLRHHHHFELISKNNLYLNNGIGDGLSHGIYASVIKLAVFIGDTFRTDAQGKPQPGMGHLVKCRAGTTLIYGCFFDPGVVNPGQPNGGTATCIDLCNGGRADIMGNIIFRNGAVVYADDNPFIKFGEEQNPGNNSNSPIWNGQVDNYAHDDRVHRLNIIKNTFRHRFAPGGGNRMPLAIIRSPYNEFDQQMTVQTLIEDNLISDDNPAYVPWVLTSYPNNTEVLLANIDDYGTVTNSPIPATNSMGSRTVYSYAGSGINPSVRTDNYRGGKSISAVASSLPSWLPSVVWQWTEIPGTTFSNYMKDNGSGIAPVAPAEVTGGTVATWPSYARQTSFGGPCYSRKNKELWMFGGGHSATTLNALHRWNIGKDSPDMTLVSPATLHSVKQPMWADTASYNASGGYWSDGKPIAPHAYQGNAYFDSIDEFVQLSLPFVCHPTNDIASFPVVPGFQRGASAWRSPGYWQNLFITSGLDIGGVSDAPVFMNWSGTELHYYNDGLSTHGMRKLVASTRQHVEYGGAFLNYWRFTKGSARHDQNKALCIGGNHPDGGYQAKMVDMTTGAITPQTVTGFAAPNSSCHDIAWVSSGGYWVAWYGFPEDDNNPMTLNVLVKLEISGVNTLLATQIIPTGTPMVGNGGCARGMYYDDSYNCLIFVGHMTENLRVLKVS